MSVFTVGEARKEVGEKGSTLATPVAKKKSRKRFNELRNNKKFYISSRNANLLTAAKHIAEDKGVAVVYVTGPSGWGKTRLAYEYARQIKYNVVYVPATSVMEGEEWFGIRNVEGDETVFRETEFAKALKQGNTVIVIDELSRVAPFVLNPLLSLMHDEGEFTVHNKTFKPAKNTIFFITANIGVEYVGTYELDPALESRLDVQLQVGSIPVTAEYKIVKGQVDCSDEVAETAVKMVRFMRNHKISIRDVSPRATIKMATLLKTGIDLKHIIGQTVDMIEDSGDKKMFIDFTKSKEFAEALVLFSEEEDD